MKIINFGSLNIDRVYTVDHLVRPGETITSREYNVFAGGKGLNQSIALARAGTGVCHAGKIGPDGNFLKDLLAGSGVDVSLVFRGEDPTGHAIIQVDEQGENSIILFGGANQVLADSEIEQVFNQTEPGDFLLLQNEINSIEKIIQEGSRKGLTLFYNPAPMTADVHSLPLEKIDWLIVNEVEGEAISGEVEPEEILKTIVGRYPELSVILTLGSDGVHFASSGEKHCIPGEDVKPVDTTGAGDTFTGYFLAEIVNGSNVRDALVIANRAAAICVTRHGAADSIPQRKEVV